MSNADTELSGTLPDGALWRLHVPTRWNGTLLLYSHGYLPDVRPPALAPSGLEPWLLQHGYALAASSYAHGGWAIADAIPDQLATLALFTARIAKPQRTLAWGESMGGLITIALAERPDTPSDGALTACGSIAGTLEMMNRALDGAFAFRTLAAPHANIRLVGTTDDRANAARVSAALSNALTTPQGRARVALAGALAGLPVWTQPLTPEPPVHDYETQLTQLAQSFVAGVFLPRAEQERVAGGVFSSNTHTDYRAQLARTGRRAWVSYFYRQAGLDLDHDLQVLNAAPRICANPAAIAYMRANYVPTAKPRVPVISYHTLGDGLTSPTLQSTYSQAVRYTGFTDNFQAAWIHGAGHCTFTAGEHLAALRALEHRLASGTWSASPDELNSLAASEHLGPARFVAPAPDHPPRRSAGTRQSVR